MLVVLLEQATESSLVPRPEKRAWYTLSAHAPKCTQNPSTSYISVK